MNAGSWNSYKPTVDFYGPLSKNTAFRINGAYETAESFRDVVESKKYYFNPSFLYNIGKKSQLIVEADYLKNDFTPDFGIGAIENQDKSYALNTFLPRNAFVGTDWQFQNVQQATTGITFNHQFNDKWFLNSVASYQNYTKDYFSSERVVWTYDNANRLKWNRPINRTYNENNYTSLQVNVNGEFLTGEINHKILVGTDGDYGTADSYAYNISQTAYGTNGAAGNIYLDDPSTWSSDFVPTAEKKDRNRIPTQRFGLYAQDFVEFNKKFKILAGLRWSYIENLESTRKTFATNIEVKSAGTVDRAFSPKAGLVFTPNENLSIFGTYTNSFSANTGRDIVTEKSLKPSIIDQFEVGVKKNFWNNAVSVNLTGYHIVNNNFYQMAQFHPVTGLQNSDSTLKEFAGKMQSRGVELDITGNPNENLSIIAGASYNHSVYKDTPDDFGYVENQRLVRTPATTANASVFYKFSRYITGLKVGATIYYIGDRIAGWNDTKTGNNSLAARNGVSRLLDVDDYSTVSLSVGYDWKKFSIMGKVGNLFDTTAYNYHENYSVNPITPRNFYFTLTYKL